ncbi:MAG: MEDS domain-containing protein [Chitinispirillaceae bacterium]|nr:MEDS domain-containing protein [Chitinispirillaceae bacterium]
MKSGTLTRPSGIEAVGALPWGSHFCQFYDTDKDLIDTLVPYFRAGLEANEFCIWVTSEPLKAEAARAALAADMPDLDRRIERGQIEFLDYDEWYTKSGSFHADEVLRNWKDKLDTAHAKGYDGLRLTGNTFWLEKSVWADFTKYEETINTALSGANIIALCTYSLHKCGAIEIAEVIANHEFALIKRSGEWQITRSIHHQMTEQSLRESEERYRSLYSAMKEGMALHEIVRDAEGKAIDYRIIDVNPAFERITGISREAAVNTLSSRLYNAGEPPYLDIYSRVAETGKPESFETHFPPMAKIFRISVFSSGKRQFATVFEDITECKQTEQALHENEERLRFAQESAGVGTWVWDIPTGKLEWSGELFRLFGVDSTCTEASFDTWRTVVHPDDLSIAEERIDAAVKNRTKLDSDYRIVRSGSEIRWIRAIGRTRYDDGGAPLRMSGICMDITEHKRHEESIRKEHRETLLANRVLRIFMEENSDGLFDKTLAAILEGTGSRHGVLGYIAEPGHLICPSLSAMLASCEIEGKCIHYPPEKWKGLWARALREKKSLFTNKVPAVPQGHVAIDNNLATPIVFQERVIGLLNQANKEGGYTEDDRDLADGITRRIAPALFAWIQRKLREEEHEKALSDQQRALRRFELLARTAGDLLHSREPQKIVEKLCSNVMHFLDCHVFFNFLTDEQVGRLHLNACMGIPEQEVRRIEWLDYGVAVCGCVARDGCRIVTEKIQTGNDERTTLVKSYGISAYVCHPLLGPGGKVIGTLSFGTRTRENFSTEDIELMKAVSDQVAAAMIRMQSERELRESQKDFKRAQSVGHIGSWRLDVNKNELTWSDENHRIFGIPKGVPMTYETFFSTIHPDDREYVDVQWQTALAGKHYDIEHRIIADGVVKWVRETAELEFDSSGKLLGGFGTTQDITSRKRDEEELLKYREGLEKLVEERTAELKKSQEQLLHAQKMEALGQLAGGIAHDFNNMMQVVIGFAYHTLRKLDFENPIRENLEHIVQAAKSASVLTHQLLSFSRKQMLQPQVVSVNDLVLKIKPILRRTLGEDVEVTYDLQQGLGHVKVDPVQLEQVIVNMAVNARNAMPDGGKLELQTAEVMLGDSHPYEKNPVAPGPYVMLAISDTGCGMDTATLEKIFEPFFTTRPFGTGSGLGLSTAYGTIRQSAGAIRVYSEPGKGTTFKIYLPRCENKIMAGSPDDAENTERAVGKTVLVVEDNHMAREFVSLELRDLGFRVLIAPSGEEAISLSTSHNGPIDLLLTDVVLPGASGWEVSKTISVQRPGIVTLYMSGYDADRSIKKGKLMAGVRLLVKPFTPEQLAGGIREVLESGASSIETHRGKPASLPSTAQKAGPLHILVVDDDPGIAEIIAEVLREPGDSVRSAEDGATALRLAGERIPDVVLLDIKLPDIDGYELSRRIRELGNGSTPYIIATSGLSPEGEAGREAFDDYIIKPVDFTRLREMIDGRPKKRCRRAVE